MACHFRFQAQKWRATYDFKQIDIQNCLRNLAQNELTRTSKCLGKRNNGSSLHKESCKSRQYVCEIFGKLAIISIRLKDDVLKPEAVCVLIFLNI